MNCNTTQCYFPPGSYSFYRHYSLRPPYPSLNLQTVQATLFRQFHPILIFRALPFNIGFFCEHQKYQSFSSFTPSHLLKVTKFLVKFSLSLNITDFLSKNCNPSPPEEHDLSFLQKTPLPTLKIEVLPSP